MLVAININYSCQRCCWQYTICWWRNDVNTVMTSCRCAHTHTDRTTEFE